VIVKEITPWEEFSGRIEATDVVEVKPRVGGVIESINYREGDLVEQGDLLFVIDPQPFRAELERAEAELERANAQAVLTRLESKRARDLVKRKLLSQGEYDQRVAAEDQANAAVRSAKASVELARLNLSYTEVRSPIAGRTGRALVTKGNLVSSDPTPDTLTSILSVDPVYVVFDSDELTYLRYFANAQQSSEETVIAEQIDQKNRTVFIGLGNEEGFPRQGYVDFVDNRITPSTGTIRIRAVLDNKDHRLTPGLFARVKLLAAESKQAVLISESAILTDQDRKYVYVLNKENQAVRRDIKTGRIIEGFRMVEAGLNSGDQIIVHGIQKVFFPNMPVSPQVIAMGDPPPSPAPSGPPAQH
jgi:multidrug efflux system membrane fusion protein